MRRLDLTNLGIGCITALLLTFAAGSDLQADNKGKVNKDSIAWSGRELAVIVNDNDPQSLQIADYYRQKRSVPAAQIIHIRIPADSNVLSRTEFETAKQLVDKLTPNHVQGYVLTWLTPYRVECMSITTAFAAGFDEAFCARGCKETRHNPYYDSISRTPYDDFGWRPTMLLAGKNIEEAKRLIDRGLASDYSSPEGAAYLLKTSDIARNSRAYDFWRIAANFNERFTSHYLEQNFIENRKDVLFYFTGLTKVPKLTTNQFLPGAIADHLTSKGGMLDGSDQMSILEWLSAGATGSYGTVVEPCNFPAKFTKPELVMHYYLQGHSLIEAYWKSVAEPGQGIFVGEPLAKPFAKK